MTVKRRYLVAYMSQLKSNRSNFTVGSVELETDKPISSCEQLKELLLKEFRSQGIRNVTVTPLSFQRFE